MLKYITERNPQKGLIIGTNLGAARLGLPLSWINSDVSAQYDAAMAFSERFKSDFIMTSMDLSVEAECFGCDVHFSTSNSPVVSEEILLQDVSAIDNLLVPRVGEKRTCVFLDAVRKISSSQSSIPLLGGVIGPFSLAASLFGVSQMLELTISDGEAARRLVEKCSQFIVEYADAFKEAGTDGVILSEPTAGLLSPRSMEKYSSIYVQGIVNQLNSPDFQIIYHNCAARAVHLDAILKTDARILHFGEPMDISEALRASGEKKIISGNLDPAKVFLSGRKEYIIERIQQLLDENKDNPNFLIASGCDLPINTPFGAVDLFYSLLRQSTPEKDSF